MKVIYDISVFELEKFAEDYTYYETAKLLNKFRNAIQKKYEPFEDYVGVKRQTNINFDLIMTSMYRPNISIWDIIGNLEYNPMDFITKAKEFGIEIEH